MHGQAYNGLGKRLEHGEVVQNTPSNRDGKKAKASRSPGIGWMTGGAEGQVMPASPALSTCALAHWSIVNRAGVHFVLHNSSRRLQNYQAFNNVPPSALHASLAPLSAPPPSILSSVVSL